MDVNLDIFELYYFIDCFSTQVSDLDNDLK